MPEIKTRDYVAKTLRSMNRVQNLSARMKSDMVRSREDQIDEKQYAVDTAESGAAEMLPHVSKAGILRCKRIDMPDPKIPVSKSGHFETATLDEKKKEQFIRTSFRGKHFLFCN